MQTRSEGAADNLFRLKHNRAKPRRWGVSFHLFLAALPRR
jgi:hypothetical protein